MYLIDTNIFLEVMLARSKKKQCAHFLSLLRDGKEFGVITDFSIHSIIIIMESLKKKKELRIFLASLTGYKGLSIYDTKIQDELEAIDISLEKNLDIEDSIQYSAALSLNADGIVSLDKHFDGMEIPRIEPLPIKE